MIGEFPSLRTNNAESFPCSDVIIPHPICCVAELPGYGCSSLGQSYSDCASACGHCSDRAGSQFMCDECVQGCTCQEGQYYEVSGTELICVPVAQCTCHLPYDLEIYPAGSIGEVGCHSWSVPGPRLSIPSLKI